MFTAQESDYLKGLLNVYKELGYKYYVAHTVTETNNNYDMYVYLSKDKITSSSPSDFNLSDNSIVIYIDSSSRNDNNYNPSVHTRDILYPYSGSLHVHIAEFIYTNADVTYSLVGDSVNPDILLTGANNYDNKLFSYGLMFIVVSIFLYTFIKSILRIRR